MVHLEKEKVDPYVNVRPLLSSTVGDLCDLIHEVRTVSFSMQVSGFSYLQETLYITHWSILWFVSWQLSLLASKNAMVIILSTSSQAPFTVVEKKLLDLVGEGGLELLPFHLFTLFILLLLPCSYSLQTTL